MEVMWEESVTGVRVCVPVHESARARTSTRRAQVWTAKRKKHALNVVDASPLVWLLLK
jgi:hypothetical protein